MPPVRVEKAAAPIIGYETLRRALLQFAVDCDREAVRQHGTPAAVTMRADAKAARARAHELGMRYGVR